MEDPSSPEAVSNPRSPESGREPTRDPPPAEDAEEARAGPHRRRALLVGAALLVTLLAAALYGPRLLYLLRHESTDDAYVHGANIIPIVPQVSGQVVELRLRDDQDVVAGELLLVIDPSEYQAALDQAEAEVARLDAALANARQELARGRPLARSGTMPPERLDTLEAAAREAKAALAAARARAQQLHHLELGRFVNPYDPSFTVLRDQLVARFQAEGAGPSLAAQKALLAVARMLEHQAAILSYDDVFWMFAAAFLLMIPFVLAMRRTREESPEPVVTALRHP